ncbi:aldose 1-epimerase [Rhizobacter sp. LjRoot28]|jgi:aldose 1-epimerase|uniref:aldose 1-epimerase n=1 Tax=Rhizobacter sp. LjRoot28 TaxID=3342309 RepID=UPI003ECF0450
MTDPLSHSVELRAGSLRLALRADLGGSIAGLWHDGTPVLRSTEPADLALPRASASYPLVPYSNRLGHRRFEWMGQSYTTVPNFGDSPHSVHGVAWLRAWDVVSTNATEAVLRYVHTPDAHWPFAFEVEQHFKLTPQALEVSFAFRNTDARAQPAGLGWHPYFPKRTRSRLEIDLTGRWVSDASELPTHRVADTGLHADVAALDVDNCFEGWTGAARIDDEQFSLQLTSDLPYLVVYTPQDKDYYCVEPVSHVSNAIQMADPAAHGLRTVEPGATFTGSMNLAVKAL